MANNKTKKTAKEKTATQKTQDTALSEVQELKLTEETVLRYINQYASKQEIALFMNQCKMFNLNPFKRQIHLIKYSQSSPASYVMSFNVFLERAERTKMQNGWKAWTEGTPKTKDFKACIEIHRKDWKMPFYHEVFWDEYAQYKQDGRTLTRFWDVKYRTMLKKVVISQGHRLCYPADLGDLPYTAEEMPVEHEKLETEPIIDAEIVKEEEKPKEKPKEEKPEPEPEPEPEPDVPPEPEEEAPEPEAPPEKEKEEEDPGDPITAQTKRFIANALTALEKDFGRDPTEIANKICDRFERLSNGKIKIEKFPDDLTEKQGRRVLEWLETTREKAEKKRLGE